MSQENLQDKEGGSQPKKAASRGLGGKRGRGGSRGPAKAGASRAAEQQTSRIEVQGRSKSQSGRSHATRGRQGAGGSSGAVSGGRCQEEKSNNDLPQAFRTIVWSLNKRPKGQHAQEGSDKSQKRPASKSSKRGVDAFQIENPWLSAAVAVGEGSVDDAMALADFVVAQPDRDYDSLLRSRYWSQTNQGSPEKALKPKKGKKG